MSSDSINLEALLLPNVFRILVTLLLTRGRHRIDLYHISDAIVISAAVCLLNDFGRFNVPHQLRLDDGSYFIADVIPEFLLLVGVTQYLTSAYSKEVNALIERN